jgi:hypothetical protein
MEKGEEEPTVVGPLERATGCHCIRSPKHRGVFEPETIDSKDNVSHVFKVIPCGSGTFSQMRAAFSSKFHNEARFCMVRS